MKIGEIAQRAHVSTSIIRYYERKGILPRASRDSLGYRDYGDADLARIQLIRGARQLGCSFAEIKAITTMEDLQNAPSEHVLVLLAHKVSEVGGEIDRLRHVQVELSRLHELALNLDVGEPV